MATTILCPSCQLELLAEPAAAPRQVACPKCQQRILLPALAPPAPVPAGLPFPPVPGDPLDFLPTPEEEEQRQRDIARQERVRLTQEAEQHAARAPQRRKNRRTGVVLLALVAIPAVTVGTILRLSSPASYWRLPNEITLAMQLGGLITALTALRMIVWGKVE